MAAGVEYKGHVLTPASRFRKKLDGWTLEVRIQPVGRRAGLRRCRAPNVYRTEERATEQCLVFGRMILDGKARRKA